MSLKGMYVALLGTALSLMPCHSRASTLVGVTGGVSIPEPRAKDTQGGVLLESIRAKTGFNLGLTYDRVLDPVIVGGALEYQRFNGNHSYGYSEDYRVSSVSLLSHMK